MNRKPYPTDVSDDERAFVAPYLTLMSEAARQRDYPLRELFNAPRWIIHAGAPVFSPRKSGKPDVADDAQ